MPRLYRMTKSQFRRTRSLIRRLCANCDGGNCLLLDDGYMPCPCPQLSSLSLICKYFRNAVLPSDEVLYAETVGRVRAKKCTDCGQPFTPPKPNTVFCKNCAQRRIRTSKRKWAERNRHQRRNSNF